MRLMPVLRRLPMILLLVVGSGVPALAQPGYPQQQRGQQGYAPPPPPGGYRDLRAYPPGYYPGKLVQPARPQSGFSLRRLFGIPDDPPPAPPPVAKPRRPAPPPDAVVRQEKPKPNPTTHVVVFGDTLAEAAVRGLDDVFADDQDVAVVRKTKADGGLVRSDADDLPKYIREVLDGGQKATLAVVMLGTNDRQPLKDGEVNAEPLSERWKDLYRIRADAVLRAFTERGLSVVWIGLPPMKNSKLSEDLIAMNEIYRESVQRNGGTYVDIWPGFVDDENRYTATGPDVDGEPARLRLNDGASFTRAGARKLAHFAVTEIKKILETGPTGMPVAAVPHSSDGALNGGLDSLEAALPAPPDAVAPVSLPIKPLVGPVLPLTRTDVTPGGALVSSPPKLNSDQAYSARRALRNGIAPNARPGRADDFRWPPS